MIVWKLLLWLYDCLLNIIELLQFCNFFQVVNSQNTLHLFKIFNSFAPQFMPFVLKLENLLMHIHIYLFWSTRCLDHRLWPRHCNELFVSCRYLLVGDRCLVFIYRSLMIVRVLIRFKDRGSSRCASSSRFRSWNVLLGFQNWGSSGSGSSWLWPWDSSVGFCRSSRKPLNFLDLCFWFNNGIKLLLWLLFLYPIWINPLLWKNRIRFCLA